MKRTALIMVLILASLLLAGCSVGKKKFAPPPKPQPYQIEILSHSMTCEWNEWVEQYITTITGKAKNNSGQTCSPALRARLYDYNEVMIGTAFDFLWDMPAGETWKFELVYWSDEKVKSYKLSVFEVYD